MTPVSRKEKRTKAQHRIKTLREALHGQQVLPSDWTTFANAINVGQILVCHLEQRSPTFSAPQPGLM